jgi:hypothetical protein
MVVLTLPLLPVMVRLVPPVLTVLPGIVVCGCVTTGAEALLKSFRLRQDEMYELSLISPTTAEKVLKDSPKRWAKAQEHITRSEGKPSVAPATDKRPALDVQTVADDFSDFIKTANCTTEN